jgi:hypothetical protein
MNLEKYKLRASKTYISFRFTSICPKGNIEKRIVYTKTKNRSVLNLAFGDVIKGSKGIDDTIVTNNDDKEKVLATVVASIYIFTSKYPNTWVGLTGSTVSRTRLYRIVISGYFEILSNDFEIYGLENQNWQVFEKNKNYDAFVIKRKLV